MVKAFVFGVVTTIAAIAVVVYRPAACERFLTELGVPRVDLRIESISKSGVEDAINNNDDEIVLLRSLVDGF